MLTRIKKRDGRIVEFDEVRIANAIYKAGRATHEFEEAQAKRLAHAVTAVLEYKNSPEHTPSVEEVQDLVEQVLMNVCLIFLNPNCWKRITNMNVLIAIKK